MTKTSKAPKITFPVITTRPNIKARRNAETGIEIHAAKDDLGRTEYTVFRTDRDGTLSYWGTEYSLAGARALATERAEMVREEVASDEAEAYEMALDMARELLAEVEAQIGGHAAERALTTLCAAVTHGLKQSYTYLYVQAINERLAKIVGALDGTKPIIADADARAALAEAEAIFPVGTAVSIDGVPTLGAVVDGACSIDAETNKVFIFVRSGGAGRRNYRSVYADRLATV
jgi:hypothetical protein